MVENSLLQLNEPAGDRTPTRPDTPLSPTERQRLAFLENLITQHHLHAVLSLYQAGLALLEIQKDRLYRSEFPTFKHYFAAKWGIHRSYGYRLLQAGRIKDTLSPLGDIPLPQNERQIRVLSPLPPEMARSVWVKALKLSAKKPITTGLLTSLASELQDKPRSAAEPLSYCQKELQNMLNSAAKAIASNDWEKALDQIDKARIRVDVEFQKSCLSASRE